MPRLTRTHPALALLAGLLLAARLVVGAHGTAAAPHGPALLFFSSNTEDGLSLRQAVDRLGAPAHERCRARAERVLRELSAGPALVHDAIGDWQDGVENSLLVVLPRSPDAGTLRRAAAWFGLIGDQKAVLAFRPEPGGRDVLVTLVVPGTLEEVRDRLTVHGVHDRTILVEADGCRVIVVVEGERYAELAAAAARMKATIDRRHGRSELLAAPTRDEAPALPGGAGPAVVRLDEGIAPAARGESAFCRRVGCQPAL
ncbi:MAG: hypothetical protein U0797_16870 [Gemmataceae bacterium]